MNSSNQLNYRSVNTNLRFISFCGAILCYAFFGYPTPDSPGLAELLVGTMLILSLGLPQSAFSILIANEAEPLWMKTGRLLLLYGLTVPLFLAVIYGNAVDAIFRDLFPFLFLLLPFFMYDLFLRISEKQKTSLLYVIIIAGLVFSLRGLLIMQEGIEQIVNIDALYLVNAPTVLFAALFITGSAIYSISFYKPFKFLLLLITALLPMAAMGSVLQRASFGALFLSAVFLSGLVLRHNLLKFLLLCAFGVLTFLLIKDSALPLIDNLLEKNRAVGSNMRIFELMAVWERVADSSITALFGQGWGGTVQSPAVGDLTVNFTHSLISSSLLKTGLFGTLLLLAFLWTLFLKFPALYRTSPVLALALFWPFMIDIFLYASYKSLDFGLILMLIACYGIRKNKRVASESAQNIIDQQGLSTSAGRDRTAIT